MVPMQRPLGKTTAVGTSQEIPESRQFLSRDVGYLRDMALFWPFVLYSIFGVASAFSSADEHLAIRFAAVAIVALTLAKEKLFLFVLGTGFIATRCTIYLFLHPWNWAVFLAAILTACPPLVASRYWRNQKLSYRFPKEFRLVDALWSLTSLCASLCSFYVVSRFNHL